MPATHINMGESEHDKERQGLRFLVDNLPDHYIVYTNILLTPRANRTVEIDAIVVAPHAIFVVELKSYNGKIEIDEHNWYTPGPIYSPVKSNHKKAQILATELKRLDFAAGRCWVQSYAFLTHTNHLVFNSDPHRPLVLTKQNILVALTDPAYLQNILGQKSTPPVDAVARQALARLLNTEGRARARSTRIREYELLSTIEDNDHYAEYLARHSITHRESRLRVWTEPPLEDEEVRTKLRVRFRWEAQILARVGAHAHILSAEPPFEDLEAGSLCLPCEHFVGATLQSWLDRHWSALQGELVERLRIWDKVADAIQFAHQQGIVHRILRPEVILLSDTTKPQVRVTGFDLAKQLNSSQTVLISTLHDPRLVWAAPEVLHNFSEAQPRSDQFSLGALLALLVAGKPLFANTFEIARRRAIPRLRDLAPAAPAAIEEIVTRLLAEQPANRFASVQEAREALRAALATRRSREPQAANAPAPRLNPEDIPPQTQLGKDYIVTAKLGEGGLSTVYEARHLVSGTSRALKVARVAEGAEDALRAEYETLSTLDHASIARVIDLSNIVDDRLTLIMPRIPGDTLARFIITTPEPDPQQLRRWADDLLQALVYLESRSVLHKDIKPDNILAGSQGLVLIDFSLAKHDPEDVLIGTPLYRDPFMERWDYAADRWAAAICLHELLTARHPFMGEAPAPDMTPQLDPEELEPPLIEFFQKALSPNRIERHPSAVAMRHAFMRAFSDPAGLDKPSSAASLDEPSVVSDDASLPLVATGLPQSTALLLARNNILSQGDLVALSPEQIRALRGIGNKKALTLLQLRADLLARGVQAAAATSWREPSLLPALEGDVSPIDRLGLKAALVKLLAQHGYSTVGRLAMSPASSLRNLPGMSTAKMRELREALVRFAHLGQDPNAIPQDTASLWAALTERLDQPQRDTLAAFIGLSAEPLSQAEIASREGHSRQAVNHRLNTLNPSIRRELARELLRRVADHLDALGGIVTLPEAVAHIEEHFLPDDTARADALLRLLAWMFPNDLSLLAATPQRTAFVAQPRYRADALHLMLDEALRLADAGADASTQRATLRDILPELPLDHLAAAARLDPRLAITTHGELFVPPLPFADAAHKTLRLLAPPLPLSLDALRDEAAALFGGPQHISWPPNDQLHAALAPALASLGLTLRHDQIDRAAPREAAAPVEAAPAQRDALPVELLRADASPRERLVALLRDAARSSSFRMIVAPPEHQRDVALDLAQRLDLPAQLHSYEHAFLSYIEDRFPEFERAERLLTGRAKLAQTSDHVFEELLRQHGAPNTVHILHDVALWQRCNALHLVRTLYDRALGGSIGFWILVVPGVVWQSQPRFNEREPVFHMPGLVLPAHIKNEFSL